MALWPSFCGAVQLIVALQKKRQSEHFSSQCAACAFCVNVVVQE